jgi:hypothetical protein
LSPSIRFDGFTLRIRRSASGQSCASPPVNKMTIYNRFVRWAAPAAAAFQHMHDAADNPAIVRPLDASDIRRQTRVDPLPLFIAQPK